MNYFEFYDLPLSFRVDEAALKRKFYELSKRFHPDFYINEPSEKQEEILEKATLNNKAYQVLSDPSRRIPYVLELKGLLAEGEAYQLPQDFLLEMMEVNEALMELEFEQNANSLEEITQLVTEKELALFEELCGYTDAYSEKDEIAQQELLLKIKDIWYRQKYLLRIRESLNRFASR
ncbi:MAG: Fe-S protein assembly co-chaperone HscB [Bacteroidota bacterium]|jgi:molecular chaperone HscB